MIIDPRLHGFSSSMNGIPSVNQSVTFSSNQIQVGGSRFRRNTFVNHKFGGIPFLPNDPSSSNSHGRRYGDKSCMLQESLDLQAAEKPFYDVLGKKYPPSPEQNPIYVDQNSESLDDCLSRNHNNCLSSSRNSSDYPSSINNQANYSTSQIKSPLVYNNNPSHSSVTSSNSVNKNIDKFMDSPISPLQEPKGETSEVVKVEKKEKKEYSPNESKGRKNPHREKVDLKEEQEEEERSSEAALIAYRKALKDRTSKKTQQNGQSKGPHSRKGHGKKQNLKKEVVDLRTLLIHYAQAVAADDRRSSSELLKQIRQHYSPWGDGNQRLAHCFANGLEADLAGTDNQIYKALVSRRTSAADYLKAYRLYLASCPFRKISNFVSNRTITMKSESAMRLHIIDFGRQQELRRQDIVWRIMLKLLMSHWSTVPLQRWDCIKLEDLKIDRDEFLVVNWEALFHFSTLFDMLTTNVPREHHERMLTEREIFGKEALNIPFEWDIKTRAIEKVRNYYHKDFVIDEDS
ncbi:hypothetical protein ACSBR2_034859 [Camellia fascicularis]